MNRTRVSRIGLILVASLVVVVVGALGGGYAWGHTSATPSAPVAQSSAPPPAQPSKGTVKTGKTKTGKTKTGKTNASAVRGSLTAIDGDAWTVQTANNGTVTVTVGADTKFGTAKRLRPQRLHRGQASPRDGRAEWGHRRGNPRRDGTGNNGRTHATTPAAPVPTR